jgi:RHH-type proline utilization regulon transcriptional repressor/proline dehydrogenase/delta 1-pyrroline-5-carboxylate dehydrogenase
MHITTTTFENAKIFAEKWQNEIEHHRERAEKEFHEVMVRMLKDPINKIFLIELLDQSFRSSDNKRIADQLEYLFSKYENTDFFTEFEQLLVWLFRHIGIYLPYISVPLFIRYLRNDVSNVVIKGEPSLLTRYLSKRRNEHTRVNINIIGEAVLGEKEAHERILKYIDALENPSIDYISIKISTIFSQISPLAHDWSVNQISRSLESIYITAMEHNKFVNLDMEEYRDVALTVDAFIQTLSQEPFLSLYAGIVIQSYIPDALSYLQKLSKWAQKRVEMGGAPIKVRLVKGANQEMELTEASLRGWPCVTYLNKGQTDANYKILIDYLLDPALASSVHTGVASHNLFDHALGMLLARERGVEDSYSAEMLEGMSETAYKLLKNEGLEVILYAPTATATTFTNAIAYLVRRFDENTAEQNFLRHSFGLQVNSPAWEKLVQSYNDALSELPNLRFKPFRSQNRNVPPLRMKIDPESYRFENESDTDFALPQNRHWAEQIRDKWKNIADNGRFHASAVIGGVVIESDERIHVIDKSQYHDKVIVGSYTPASAENIQEAVRVAAADPDGWRKLDLHSRQKILMKVAHEFRQSRDDLIGIAAAETGKVFSETDVEVSEAIDLCNFYPYSVREFTAVAGIHSTGKGVGVVISPWNFPIAIPTGGIAAALASGNTVILKPSSDAVLCAYRLCQCFWEGGISKNTLQFVPTSGELAGKYLITNPLVDFVIFTGGESTAYAMIKARPDLHLSAETGGKDATIITALADRDQAIKNVVASAFNNSGQKCSATSLLILEKEVYDDEHFKQTLIDAASSLQVGSVWDFKNRIGALITPPSGVLKYSLEYLSANESWALEPAYSDDNNPYMLRPSIRWGTKNGDFCHINELFGPVLSVMRAENLEHAIELVNATGYGLTSGLESLDEREQEIWKEKLLAGNLYINRPTTGAIVMRQPFGGMGKSSIGSGRKAGGFNYVSQFMNLSFENIKTEETLHHPYIDRLRTLLSENTPFVSELQTAITTAENFAYWLDHEFTQERDVCRIRGESNTVRYRNVKSVLLRFESGDSVDEICASIAAVKMAGAKLSISIPSDSYSQSLSWLVAKKSSLLDLEDTFSVEDQTRLLKSMEHADRVRYLKPENISTETYQSIADKALYISAEPFIPNGRIELMHYFKEQSISNSYHRYGNLGIHALSKENT